MNVKVKKFDAWAANYDQLLATGKAPISFDGYERVLEEVVEKAMAKEGMRVLDLGTGTGNLAALFLDAGCDVWGLDFSAEMLAKAKEKLPQLHIVQADLLDDEWPLGLDQGFDRIVSAYVLYNFNLPYKIQLLERLAGRYLADNGRIVIADIAYRGQTTRAQAQAYWGKLWSEDEHYWAADETMETCRTIGLDCTYRQVSSCAGVFAIEKAG